MYFWSFLVFHKLTHFTFKSRLVWNLDRNSMQSLDFEIWIFYCLLSRLLKTVLQFARNVGSEVGTNFKYSFCEFPLPLIFDYHCTKYGRKLSKRLQFKLCFPDSNFFLLWAKTFSEKNSQFPGLCTMMKQIHPIHASSLLSIIQSLSLDHWSLLFNRP